MSDIVLSSGFAGLNRSLDASELSEGESPSTLDAALASDTQGVLGPRKGRSVAYTNSFNLLGVIPANLTNGRYRILCDTSGAWLAKGLAWPGRPTPSDKNLGSMNASARVRGVQYRNQIIAFNGRDRTRTFDGRAWENAGIAQYLPIVTPTTATNGAGNLTGKYRYYIVPVNSKKVTPACLQGQAGLPSEQSVELVTVANKVTVSGIPTHPDSQVDYWYIFRNQANRYTTDLDPETQLFYYVGQVANGTTSFSDNVADGSLLGAELVRFQQKPPASMKYGAVYGDRFFSAGFDPLITGTATIPLRAVSAAERTSGVTTLTLTTNHGLSVGDTFALSGATDSTMNTVEAVITAVPTVAKVSYANAGTDVVPGVSTGTWAPTRRVTFSGVTLNDSIVGCWFVGLETLQRRRIAAVPSSTSITLDGPYNVAGATSLSGSYVISRDPGEVFFSELDEPEACGPETEGFRNCKRLPAKEDITGLHCWNGMLLVFTVNNTYAISGIGAANTDIHLLPDPIFAGIGCVGQEAIGFIDGALYFLSLKGPVVLPPGGGPQLIGQNLLTDWIDPLTVTDLQYAVCVASPKRVWFSVPNASGDVEASKTYRYERIFGIWFEETGLFPAFGYCGDEVNGVPALPLVAQTRFLLQLDTGLYDMTAADYTGTVTTGGTTTLTNTGGAFITSGSGLEDRFVHVYRAGVWVGSRRLLSNTSTVLTWGSSGVGGGTLTVAIGDTYVVGPQRWTWTSRTIEGMPHTFNTTDLYVNFATISASKTVIKTDILDGSAQSTSHTTTAAQRVGKWDGIAGSVNNYAALLESVTRAQVRAFILKAVGQEGEE